jgi:hypothetical protein
VTNSQLVKAIRDFVEKYDRLEPALNNAFLMVQIHGRPYTGENWSQEIAALRAIAYGRTEPA